MDQGFAYALLRDAGQGGSGFARLEIRRGRGRVTLRARLPGLSGGARALLLAGDPDTGAVLDLGPLRLDAQGGGELCRQDLSLPRQGFAAYHTLAVAADWPRPALRLYSPLGRRPGPPLWQLRELVARYLSVPASGAAPPPRRSAPPPSAPPRRPGVDGLPRRRWPPSLAPLMDDFDRLPPCAPFDAPGWRFVQMSLPPGSPAPYCAVGVRFVAGTLQAVAYALPAAPDAPCPASLTGYRWLPGRHGQGYWVSVQWTADAPAPPPPEADPFLPGASGAVFDRSGQ